VRALDLAKMLNFHRSMEGALKFAQRMRLPALEERVGLLIQAKAQEAELTAALGLTAGGVGLSQSQQMQSQSQTPVTYVAPSLGKENHCSSQVKTLARTRTQAAHNPSLARCTRGCENTQPQASRPSLLLN